MSRSDDIELDYDDGYPAGFTMLDNRDIWQEKCQNLLLRPAALGVWVAMVSLPRKWRFREEWLCRELHLGRDALRRALRELEASGRLERRQHRGSNGEFTGCQWFLRRGGIDGRSSNPRKDLPPTENPSTAGPSPADPPRLASTETTVKTETTPTTETTTATRLVPPSVADIKPSPLSINQHADAGVGQIQDAIRRVKPPQLPHDGGSIEAPGLSLHHDE